MAANQHDIARRIVDLIRLPDDGHGPDNEYVAAILEEVEVPGTPGGRERLARAMGKLERRVAAILAEKRRKRASARKRGRRLPTSARGRV